MFRLAKKATQNPTRAQLNSTHQELSNKENNSWYTRSQFCSWARRWTSLKLHVSTKALLSAEMLRNYHFVPCHTNMTHY